MNEPKLRFNNDNSKLISKKLNEFCVFVGGGTPSKQVPEYWGNDIPWISSSDLVENDLFKISVTRNITTYGLNNSATKVCPKGSIVIVTRVGVGKLAITDRELCTSQDFTNIIKVENVNSVFLVYALYNKIKKLSTQLQGTSIKGITTEEIKSIVVNIPSTREQQKIANFLSLIDRKIELQEKKIALLKDYKKGVVEKVKSNEYVQVQLKTLCSQISSNRTLSSTENLSGDFPIYDSNGVLTFIDNYDIETEYISIIKDGAGVGRLNKCKKKSSVIATLSALVPSSCTVDYLYLVLEMINFKKYITGSTIPHIYFKDYSNEYVPFPNIQTQYDLSRMNSLMLKKIQKSEMCIEQIKQLKSSLLQQMFI